MKKYILITLGFLFLLLGGIGIFLPILPTTPFILLASACFFKSSPKFYKWMITNRLFGKYIRDYREKKIVPLRVKVFTIVFLWLTILSTIIFAVNIWFVRIILLLIAIGVTIHILMIKTSKYNVKGTQDKQY